MPVRTRIGVGVHSSYAGYAGGAGPPDVQRIQDPGFDTGTGWSGTGTIGAGTGTMTVGQTLIAALSAPLIAGQSYTLTTSITSGSAGGQSLEVTLGSPSQTVQSAGAPPSPVVFVATGASTTLTLQTFDVGTLVLTSITLTGP